jgi:hypothetical protein
MPYLRISTNLKLPEGQSVNLLMLKCQSPCLDTLQEDYKPIFILSSKCLKRRSCHEYHVKVKYSVNGNKISNIVLNKVISKNEGNKNMTFFLFFYFKINKNFQRLGINRKSKVGLLKKLLGLVGSFVLGIE